MTAEDDQRAARAGELEERRKEKGRRPGEDIVRIIRPHRDDFRRAGPGVYIATDRVLEADTPLGRLYDSLRRVLIGKRLPTEAESLERVSKKLGLPIFASDNISSSAYATEEMMRILKFAGLAGLSLTIPLHVAILLILAIVVLSYLQAIRAYPNGGGSYVVASENLGMIAGLVAAAALFADYILTVSVSVAAGVAAVGAAAPWFYDNRIFAGVLFILALTLGNLRGIRESGNIFAAPTYLYVFSLGGVLLYGIVLNLFGALPHDVSPREWLPLTPQPLALLLVLRAFASGASGLTGVEAVANGVPAFQKPEARNASITLVIMAVLFGSIFFAVGLLASAMGVVPDPSEQQTLLSQIVAALVGDNSFGFYVVQVATTLILALAANTSFNGFPRLAAIMANDRFMPRQFSFRGDRLAYSTGILALAGLSAALLVSFGGSVASLIPLYTIGVFIAFTLTQAGLVRYWRANRKRGWRLSAAINAVGAVATGVVAVEVAASKFTQGAWMVILVMPVFVALFYGIHRHYREVEDMLVIATPEEALRVRVHPRVIVPVGRIDRAHIEALQIARQMSGDVTAVLVASDPEEAKRFGQRWRKLVPDIPLVIIESPYRSLIRPLLAYIDAIDKGGKKRPVMVILSEFVPRHWWEWPLHNQTALRLKLALFFRPNTVVLDVPYMARDDDHPANRA
ncbi:MAG: APC family permease [Chloroflexi bacterium]|nr:MAG: APC family permease [Chloroflexota bacterium]